MSLEARIALMRKINRLLNIFKSDGFSCKEICQDRLILDFIHFHSNLLWMSFPYWWASRSLRYHAILLPPIFQQHCFTTAAILHLPSPKYLSHFDSNNEISVLDAWNSLNFLEHLSTEFNIAQNHVEYFPSNKWFLLSSLCCRMCFVSSL